MTAQVDMLETAQDHYLAAVLEGREDLATAIVDMILLRDVPPAVIVHELIAPVQVKIGALWQQGRIGVPEEHIATAIAETCLQLPRINGSIETRRGRVLLASAEGEWHTVPVRMVALVWQSLGWEVVTITPSAPSPQLYDLARGDASVVAGVSCSSASNLVGAWKTVTALRAAGMRVIVGGRIFDRAPNLAHIVGADAYDADPERAADWLEEARVSRKMVRGPVLQDEWERLEQVWQALPKVVEDSLRLAPHLAPLAISQTHAREHLRLIASTSVSAALVDMPQLLTDHMTWCREVLAARGVDESFADVLVAAIDRELPEGSARVRSLLATAAG